MITSIALMCIAFIIWALYVEYKLRKLFEICFELNERNKEFNRILVRMENGE